jgi:outer membrane protein
MNRNLTLLTALGAGLALASVAAPFAAAQAPATPAPAAAAPAAPPAPQAIVAKIALVNFEQVVLASNEGQTVTLKTQQKYEPKKVELDKLGADIETMKKGLTPTMTDEARAKLLREIDVKEKQLQRDADDANTAYQSEWQEALSGVAGKIANVMKKYAADTGFTLLLDVSSQQSNVLWAGNGQADISQAVVDLYNKESGIPAPAPPSPKPAAARPTAPKPAATKPPTN